jgi:hypothetical protein
MYLREAQKHPFSHPHERDSFSTMGNKVLMMARIPLANSSPRVTGIKP